MKLELYQTLPTSGARCVCLFNINDKPYIALAQLAEDVEGSTPNMNGGNSNTHAPIYAWQNNKFEHFQNLSVHGGEHIDFAMIDNKPMLAIANIREGIVPNFNSHIQSQIFHLQDNQFILKQLIPSFAAKSTCFMTLAGNDYLFIAEGVLESKEDENIKANNNLYQWRENTFHHVQAMPTVWGYDSHSFVINGHSFLAVGDNISSSKIYIWQNNQFTLFQEFSLQGGGRGFCHFEISGEHYMAFANLLGDSFLYHWKEGKFQQIKIFSGAGTRSFHFAMINNTPYLFKTNFITGTRDAPKTKQTSLVYQWLENDFREVAEYITYGGTDAKTFSVENEHYLVVSNSLTEDCHFRVDSNVYKLHF